MRYAGIILLGGKAQRLGGGDKSGLMLGQQSCFERVYKTLSKTIDEIALSVASGQSSTLQPELTHIEDVKSPTGKGGVALAILACLQWAKSQDLKYIITTPVDTPFLPTDFVSNLVAQFEKAKQSVPVAVQCEDDFHGLHALWPVACLDLIRSLILDEGGYKIRGLHKALKSSTCEFERGAYDPFMNINTPADIDAAQKVLQQL